MAAAGFFAIGGKSEPDLVECFICSKQLDGWDPDDNPWYRLQDFYCNFCIYNVHYKCMSFTLIIFRNEHIKHQPECAFVKSGKMDENSWTIRDLFGFLKLYTVKECVSILYLLG